MTKKNGKRNVAVPMLKESAHEIWLAGLGAFALAGEEGGKLFKQLVKKGEGMEKLNKTRINQLVARVEDVRGEAQTAARKAVARLGDPLESGMTAAMHKIGMPTRKEISELTRRVEELTRVVAKSKAKARRTRQAHKGGLVGAA